MVEKRSVREVSVKMGVDMRRIGAVVRLVELEKRWKAEVCSFLSYCWQTVDCYPLPNTWSNDVKKIISISL